MIQCFCSGQEADCLEAAVVQRGGFSLISAEKERKSDWLQFWKNCDFFRWTLEELQISQRNPSHRIRPVLEVMKVDVTVMRTDA